MDYTSFNNAVLARASWLDPPEDTREVLDYCERCGCKLREYDEVYDIFGQYYCTDCIDEKYAYEKEIDTYKTCSNCDEPIEYDSPIYILPKGYRQKKNECFCENCIKQKTLEIY